MGELENLPVFGDSVFGDSVFGDSVFGDSVFGDSSSKEPVSSFFSSILGTSSGFVSSFLGSKNSPFGGSFFSSLGSFV